MKNAENLLVIKDAPELVHAYEANVQAHAAHCASLHARKRCGIISSSPHGSSVWGRSHGTPQQQGVPGARL